MHSVLTQLVDEDIGPGKMSRELVRAASAHIGAAGGVALGSYHSALSLAAAILGLGAGEAVVISALSPSIYLDVLSRMGLRVLAVDVEAGSGAMAPGELASALAEGPSAVFAHHTLGFRADLSPCADGGVRILEDSSHLLAAASEENAASPVAELVVASLEGESLLSAGSGGLLLSPRRQLLGAMREEGMGPTRYQRLGNMNAALALSQLGDLERDRARRKELAGLFLRAAQKSRHRMLLGSPDGESPAFGFPVRLSGSLQEARQYARRHGVETRPAYEDSCAARSEGIRERCPEARKLLLSCLLFPLYPMMGRKTAETVARVLSTLP
jgi:dTDP-4-amino-4,6-dideoxygalactose transaminase